MEKNNNNETKKILNDLLQKLLERRLNKLEKRNIEEESVLRIVNKESQKSILALEECSHKVRKQIYLMRNKYIDERRSQNTIRSSTKKPLEIPKSKNNQNNINTNLFSNLATEGNISNLKKPEIYHHEKEEKLKIKKRRISTISPKSLKTLQLEDKMKTIQKSIKDLKAKFKSTKNIKKVPIQKHFLTENTTPKKKSKNKNLYINNKKKVTKKNSGNFAKTANNFHPSTHKNEKNEVKKENKFNNKKNELSINDIEKDEDLRISLLKLDDDNNKDLLIEQNHFYKKLDEQRENSPIKEQQNIKEESLLINNLNNLNNEINEIVNNLHKNENKTPENNNIINNDNINNNGNENDNKNICDNLEKVNKDKKNDESKIVSNNINNIDDIIIPKDKKNNIDYLAEDTSINFTLVAGEEKIEENYDNNKTIDLNISNLSEHLTLEEKFQNHLDDILIYADNKDICNLLLINKECFKTIINFLISKTEIKNDIFEEEISTILEENKNMINLDINNLKVKIFQFNANSSRAISLLNTISTNNFLKIKNEFLNNKEISIIFNILLIAIGKNDILIIDDIEKKWDYIFSFFKDYINNQSMGSFIEKELNGKKFDYKIIYSLYRYAYKHINIISPNHFQKINKDIAILVFIIKDMLEHLGILTDTKLNPEKEIVLVNSRMKRNKEILYKLNEINNKIN